MTDPEPLFAHGVVAALATVISPPPVLRTWGTRIRWPGPAGAAVIGVRREVPDDLDVVAQAVASRTAVVVVGDVAGLEHAGVREVLPRDCAPADLAAAVQRLSPSAAAANRASAAVAEPTARELEVVTLLAQGMTNREIASTLFISEHTVRNHVGHLFAKLGVNSRTQAVVKAGSLGWLRLPG